MSKLTKIEEIETYDEDFVKYEEYNLNDLNDLNNDIPQSYNYSHFSPNNDHQNDLDSWSQLFGESNRENNRESNGYNNGYGGNNTRDEIRAYSMIQTAFECDSESLILNKAEFKNNVVSKKITKLEKLKLLQINDCNLEEISYFPPNVETLKVTDCVLKIFDTSHAPQSIKILSLENNLIELFLDGNILINLVELNLSSNKLEHIPILPSSIIKLNLSNNNIEKIDNLNELTNLKQINLGGNSIETFENIPFTVELINIAKNNIEFLDLTLYTELIQLKVHSNELQMVENLPETLEYIDFSQNNLNYCPKIGSRIKYLDLSYNKLQQFPEIVSTQNLETFDITSNDDLELTNDVITKMIDLKSNVKMCFFDQFQVDENVVNDENVEMNYSDDSDSSSSSSDSWGCDEDLIKEINSNTDNYENIKNFIEDKDDSVDSVDSKPVDRSDVNTVQETVQDTVQEIIEETTVKVTNNHSKRIEINIKRIYTL